MKEILAATYLINDLENRGLYKQADKLAAVMTKLAQQGTLFEQLIKQYAPNGIVPRTFQTAEEFLQSQGFTPQQILFAKSNPATTPGNLLQRNYLLPQSAEQITKGIGQSKWYDPRSITTQPGRKTLTTNTKTIYKDIKKSFPNMPKAEAEKIALKAVRYNRFLKFLKLTGPSITLAAMGFDTVQNFEDIAKGFGEKGPSYFVEALNDPKERLKVAIALSEIASYIPVVGPFARIFNIGASGGLMLANYIEKAEAGESQKIIDMNITNALNNLTESQKQRLEQAKKLLDLNPDTKLSELFNSYGPKTTDENDYSKQGREKFKVQQEAFRLLLSEYKKDVTGARNQPMPELQGQPQEFLDPTKFETSEQKALRELSELRSNLVPTDFRKQLQNTRDIDQRQNANFQFIMQNTLGPMIQNFIRQGYDKETIINNIKQNVINDMKNNLINNSQAGTILQQANEFFDNIQNTLMTPEQKIKMIADNKYLNLNNLTSDEFNIMVSEIQKLRADQQSDALNLMNTYYRPKS